MPEWNGVDVDHPAIVKAIQNMTLQGANKEKIMRVTGMNSEIVDKHQKAMPKEK